jgi:hypothetical protein
MPGARCTTWTVRSALHHARILRAVNVRQRPSNPLQTQLRPEAYTSFPLAKGSLGLSRIPRDRKCPQVGTLPGLDYPKE